MIVSMHTEIKKKKGSTSNPKIKTLFLVSFGIGLNKPDIRTVIIADTPENMSLFSQLTGRAGRDGQPAQAIVLYQPNDLHNLQL